MSDQSSNADDTQSKLSSSRRHDVDWIRTIAIFLLIVYHASISFQPWAEYAFFYRNDDSMEWLWTPMSMLNVWRIPILFLISGMGVAFAMRRRNTWALLKDRALRIFVPYLFGLFTIGPLVLYLIIIGIYENSAYFTYEPDPMHLWFLGNIFFYVVILLPLLYLLKNRPDNLYFRGVRAILRWPLGLGLFMFALPLMLETLIVDPTSFETYAETVHGFVYGLICFFIGFTAVSLQDDFWQAVRQVRWIAVAVGAVLFALRQVPSLEGEYPLFLHALESLSWMLAVIGFAAVYLNHPSPTLRYLRVAVYPVYIFHFPIQYGISYVLFPTALPPMLKFIILVGGTLALSFLLFEIVKRINYLRPLFGLKWIPRQQDKELATAS